MDFVCTFVYNLFVFWGLTQLLDIHYFGDLAFLLAIGVLLSPAIVLSLPNFILLSNKIRYQDKVNAARLYTQAILIALLVPLAILLYCFSYKILMIFFVLQSLLSISEIIPRTLWKNRSAKSYTTRHICLVTVKITILLFLFFKAPENFMLGVITLNFITTVYFWKSVKAEKLSLQESLLILKQAWVFSKPLLISGLIVLLYTRTDQLMIKFMIDSKALAEYSVAIKVSDGVNSVWTSVQAFFLHVLLTNQERYRSFISLAWIYGIICFIVIFFVSDIAVLTIFGSAFVASSDVIKILSFGTAFVALNSVGAIWLQSKNLGYLTPLRSMCGLVVNVIGNVIMIPAFGIAGAALSTVFSQFAVCFIAPFFSRHSLKLIKLQILLRV